MIAAPRASRLDRAAGTEWRALLGRSGAIGAGPGARPDLELVISDNASDDGTEEICRQFARSDSRVRYHRQPQNIGLVANFNTVLHLARGPYFKWMGDDDWLTPTYVSRCVEVLEGDATLILVTTQQAHVGPDGAWNRPAMTALGCGPLGRSSGSRRCCAC